MNYSLLKNTEYPRLCVSPLIYNVRLVYRAVPRYIALKSRAKGSIELSISPAALRDGERRRIIRAQKHRATGRIQGTLYLARYPKIPPIVRASALTALVRLTRIDFRYPRALCDCKPRALGKAYRTRSRSIRFMSSHRTLRKHLINGTRGDASNRFLIGRNYPLFFSFY